MANGTDPFWDEEFDIVIVGSGFAGLAAAVELTQSNSSFVILEKMAKAGGTSVNSSGELSVVGSPQQKQCHIGDSAHLLAQDMLVNGEFQNSPEIIRYVAEQSNETYRWLTDDLGVQWTQGVVQAGGHSVPRTIATMSGSGYEIYQALRKKLSEKGVSPRLNCYAQNILRNPSGRIEGVVVREGYKYPCLSSGRERRIKVRQGVILAHGGITADALYRGSEETDPISYTALASSSLSPGGLWGECSKIRCYLKYSNWIRSSWNNPLEKDRGLGWKFAEYAAATFGLWVNAAGKRFVNESANRKIRSEAISKESLLHSRVFGIANQDGVQSLEQLRPGYLQKVISFGSVRKYLSLDELEEKEGFPQDNLKNEISNLNELIKKRPVDKFGRYLRTLTPLENGPWYITTLSPKVHLYLGGLVVDISGRVLDAKTQKPIPNLFAAGECTSGIHGACRLGSCSTMDSLVMGRAVGRYASRVGTLTNPKSLKAVQSDVSLSNSANGSLNDPLSQVQKGQ